MLKYSPMPPHTPAIQRLVRDLYNRLISIKFPPISILSDGSYNSLTISIPQPAGIDNPWRFANISGMKQGGQ
jgi:hypothetical protein